MIDFINGDCMEYMRKMPDKAFDLAIVDPPYGDANGGGMERSDSDRCLCTQSQGRTHDQKDTPNREPTSRFGGRFAQYKRLPEDWNQTGGITAS